MAQKVFMKAEEVAAELGVSQAYAYKLIRRLNAELNACGFITIGGRVSRKYLTEKIYGRDACGKGAEDERIQR